MTALKQPAARQRRLRVAQAAGPIAPSRTKAQLRAKSIQTQATRCLIWFLLLHLDRLALSVLVYVPFQSQIRLVLWLWTALSMSLWVKGAFRSLAILSQLHGAILGL
jgi:hypothetical protein